MTIAASSYLGTILDRKYKLTRHIGDGGMAYVFATERLHIGDLAALKLLNPELSRDATKRRRFQLEAYTTASVKHPNVVIIYDYDETDKNESYIVMELLNGQTLSSELKQLKVLRLERVMEIIQPVCSALGLAHQKGILHRDLKPGNIFLHHLEDGTEVVKLIDFGIGKLLNDGNMPLTQQGFVVGTPEYLSPERYSGKDIDERSDIYSLGVLVYRMLTGRVPFTGKTAQEILQKHLKEPPVAPRKYNQHLSTEVEEVVLRALSKDPKERPETTAKFAYELMAARISSGDTLQNMPILQQP